MEFKVGDIITATGKNDNSILDGIKKAKVNYVYKKKNIIVVEILEHKKSYYNGYETTFVTSAGIFKPYKKSKTLDLKPCPICGSDAEIITKMEYDDALFVRCTKLGCIEMRTGFDNYSQAAEAWNRRTYETD